MHSIPSDNVRFDLLGRGDDLFHDALEMVMGADLETARIHDARSYLTTRSGLVFYWNDNQLALPAPLDAEGVCALARAYLAREQTWEGFAWEDFSGQAAFTGDGSQSRGWRVLAGDAIPMCVPDRFPALVVIQPAYLWHSK